MWPRVYIQRIACGPNMITAHAGCRTDWKLLRAHTGDTRPPALMTVGIGRIDATCVAANTRRKKAEDPAFHFTFRYATRPCLIRLNGKRMSLPAHSYVIVSPKDSLEIEPGQAFSGMFIAIGQGVLRPLRETAGIPKTAGPFDFSPTVKRLTPPLKVLMDRFTAFVETPPHSHQELWQPSIMFGTAAQLLAELWTSHPNGLRERLREAGYDHTADPRLQRAIAHLRHTMDQPLNIEEAARAAGLSRVNVFRLFKLHVGCSPRDYLRLLRVEHAERLFRLEAHPSWDGIAARVGLKSGWALHKAFILAKRPLPTLKFRLKPSR